MIFIFNEPSQDTGNTKNLTQTRVVMEVAENT